MNKIEWLLHFRKAKKLTTLECMVNRAVESCDTMRDKAEVWIAACDREQEIDIGMFMFDSVGLTNKSQRCLKKLDREAHEEPVSRLLKAQACNRVKTRKERLALDTETLYFRVKGKIPIKYVKLATDKLKKGRGRRTNKYHYLVINVGYEYRLLSKDDGLTFTLMTHAVYNKEVDL